MSGPFDNARYEALLEGLEITIASLSDVLEDNPGFRVDSEYLSKYALCLFTKMHRYPLRRISEISRAVTDGIHASIDFAEGSGIKLISAKHPKENYFALEGCDEIASAQHEANPRTALRCGDVVISTVGTIGNAAVVDAAMLPANSDRHVGIIRTKEGWQPEFVSSFLLSKYGRFQTEREVTGNVQPNLFISKLKDLYIPELPNSFRKAVQSTVVLAGDKRRESLKAMNVAERTLLDALGLADWRPPEPLTYTCGSRDVLSTQRLDAEYFLPKYGALYVEMKSRLDLKALAVAGQVTKGVTVAYADEGLIPIIRSGDLVDISDDERFLRSNKTADIFYLERGDVLISSIGFGSIGKVQVFDREGKYGTVSEVTVVRQKSFNPYYLAAYLRSMAGQMQIERYITGATGQLHLYPKDVAKILVPVIPEKEQNAFETIALRAAAFKQEARDLLARAQRTVEIAIEEGEAAGMAVLAGGNHV